MKKLCAILLVFTMILSLSTTAFAWTDYYDRDGNEVYIYTDTTSASGYNNFGGVLFTIYDRCEWTVDKAKKQFAECNYGPSSIAFTKVDWYSLWQQVGGSDAKFWVNRSTQKEATSAMGVGFGLGLSGKAKATSTSAGAEGTLSVTVGQTAYYWGSTSINTISGYANKVSLVRSGSLYY